MALFVGTQCECGEASFSLEPNQVANCCVCKREYVGCADGKGGFFATPYRRTAPATVAGVGKDDSLARKETPLFAGCLSYFPDALLAVARLSKIGNDKHNPGQPLHWSKDKSTDHADCLARHLLNHGRTDPDTGLSHTAAVAWRALALLQVEIETAQKAGGA